MSTTGKFTLDTWRGPYATAALWKNSDQSVRARAPWLWLAVLLCYIKACRRRWL